MATLYSTEGTKENNPVAKNLLDADTAQASVVYSNAQYVTTGSETSADTVYMIKIPEGYTPIGQSFVLYSDGVNGTTCTATVGTVSDPNSIIANGKDINSAGTFFSALAADAGADTQTPVTTTADGWIVVDFATLTGTLDASKVINLSGMFAKA